MTSTPRHNSVAGKLGLRELALLNRPPHAAALEDAWDHLRRAHVAMRAIDHAQVPESDSSALRRLTNVLELATRDLSDLRQRLSR